MQAPKKKKRRHHCRLYECAGCGYADTLKAMAKHTDSCPYIDHDIPKTKTEVNYYKRSRGHGVSYSDRIAEGFRMLMPEE